MEPLFVSITDAGNALGVARTTMYVLVRSGKLETRKLGRRRLVSVASLRQLASELD